MIPISKPSITEAEKKAVMEVLESGMLAQGQKTEALERQFAELCGTQCAVATSSGTTALHLALLAHGLGPGDDVITSPFTFVASTNSILFVGASPVLVDIEPDTFNLDPSLIEAAITPRTKAILPVHLYGHPCDMAPIMKIAEAHNLAVIEDAAQAVGARYQGAPAGGFGTGVFSLYATKNVMAAEGGMITTNDPELAERCRMLRNHGMRLRYQHEMLGYNFRISDLHAAIGLAQFERLESLTGRRRSNAKFLSANLTRVQVPAARPNVDHVWHQYTVRVPADLERDQVVDQLRQAGVGTGVFYPVPVHKYPHIRQLVGDPSLPVAERAAEQVVSLPVHPLLSDEDLAKIVASVNAL